MCRACAAAVQSRKRSLSQPCHRKTDGWQNDFRWGARDPARTEVSMTRSRFSHGKENATPWAGGLYQTESCQDKAEIQASALPDVAEFGNSPGMSAAFLGTSRGVSSAEGAVETWYKFAIR